MSETQPEVTVVLLIGRLRERGARALHSLLAQSAVDRMEVLVFDYGSESHPPVAGSQHPAVRIIGRSRLEPFGRARAEAVRMARGEIVAFLEEHCVAFPGWAEAVLRAHAQGWDGVGPEVHTGNPGVGVSDAIAVMNYVRWLPAAEPGECELLVGNNSSYRRASLLERADLERWMACDPLLQWKLAEGGSRLGVDPAVKIAHWNEVRIPVIARGYYLWNRVFAPLRSDLFRWPRLRRLLWILLLPVVPWVRTIRLGLEAFRREPSMGSEFVRGLPTIVVSHVAAAVGAGVGWILGPGDAETRFLEYELVVDRPGGRPEGDPTP